MLMQISLDLPDKEASVPLCRRTLCYLLRELEVEEPRIQDIQLALGEAAGNVIRHAYEHPGNRYRVSVQLFIDRVLMLVEDAGRGFRREDVPEPGEEQVGGWGLWIIEQLASTAQIRMRPEGGSILEAVFRLPGRIDLESYGRGQPPESGGGG
jgi:anti-sigma regulatory factor (Ser/Thr protein kinase)